MNRGCRIAVLASAIGMLLGTAACQSKSGEASSVSASSASPAATASTAPAAKADDTNIVEVDPKMMANIRIEPVREQILHRQLTATGSNESFIMGPWIHGGWNGGQANGASLGHVSFGSETGAFFRERIELPFFEWHLKGKGEFKAPKALIFETGTNVWREEASLIPEGYEKFVNKEDDCIKIVMKPGAA